MSLWKTNSDDESEDENNDVFEQSMDDSTFDISIHTRETEKALRRETNSTYVFSSRTKDRLNRLKSIQHDSKFIDTIYSRFPQFPFVGNSINDSDNSQRTMWTMVHFTLSMSFIGIL
jgi:hypothetical protein